MRDAIRKDPPITVGRLIDTSDMRSVVAVPPPMRWMRLLDAFRHFRYACALRHRRDPVSARLIAPENRLIAGVYKNADGTPCFVRGD